MSDRREGMAIFHVSVFNRNTADSLSDSVDRARREMGRSLKGVVLDLRGNPGGLLDQAVDTASLFLDRGPVVATRGRHPTSIQNYQAGDHDHLRGIPMVVLVNGASASAAEIVAAALQDDGRAVVIGSSSYGKGTVQMVLSLENGGELTLTWARLVAPTGYLLHEHGVVPSFCTSDLPTVKPGPEARGAELALIVDRGIHPRDGAESRPRAALDETDWAELRHACPTESHENPLDLELAIRVLRDPTLYARALALPGVALAHLGAHATHSPLQ
jgi:carboxyl-terminal processing protease